jgi:hypothetical protein
MKIGFIQDARLCFVVLASIPPVFPSLNYPLYAIIVTKALKTYLYTKETPYG